MKRYSMSSETAIEMARANLGGYMESSAKLCLDDAISLQAQYRFDEAKIRALKSLKYSVGVFHPAYRLVEKST